MTTKNRSPRRRRTRAAARHGLRPVGLAGLAWGLSLLAAGDRLFDLLERRPPSHGEHEAIVVLGLRHAAQGGLQFVAPHHLGRLYAVIDAIHAASMIAMAVAAPQRRRATMLSGAVAAAAGLASARAQRG